MTKKEKEELIIFIEALNSKVEACYKDEMNKAVERRIAWIKNI